jgi:transcriptional regulator with XRE-family HTH domain
VKVLTIDQIIGANLKELIEDEGLTVDEAADALAGLSGETWSDVKLWRWESGKYNFKAADLFLLSRIFGRNVIAFLEPPKEVGTKNKKEKVTHVIVDETTYSVERYRADYLLDPRGSFLDRATDLAERKKNAPWDVEAALTDIKDNLGERAQLTDFHAALKQTRLEIRMLRGMRKNALDNPTPENIADYEMFAKDAEAISDRWKDVTEGKVANEDIDTLADAIMGEQVDKIMERKTDTVLDVERNDDGVNRKEPQ